MEETTMSRTPGIDVSRWQAEIDWPRVAAGGYRFAIIRASVGNYYTDPRFYENWRGASDAGLLVSAYHVVKPNQSAESQIARLFEVLEGRTPDLPLVMDVEVADGQTKETITNLIRECGQRIQQQEGRRPIIYTGKWFWEPNVFHSSEWAQYDLWIAHYGVQTPTLPAEWNVWRFWQYSESGSVDGVSSRHTDLDWFNGSYEELVTYAGKTTPPDGVSAKEKTAPAKGKIARVTSPFLRIRSGPGVQYDQVGELHSGDMVEIAAIDGKEVWVSIGPNQWVAMVYAGERYLKLE
jgi:lysozyme